MGSYYKPPPREGPNPYTRSGIPPPKLEAPAGPHHAAKNKMSLEMHMKDVRSRVKMSPEERDWRR